MDYTYYDIEACIRMARRQRSDALGDLLVAAWKSSKNVLRTLQHDLVLKISKAVRPSTAVI